MADLTKNIMKSVEGLVFHLNAARKKARLFPATHTSVAEVITRLMESVQAIHKEVPKFSLAIANGELFFDGHLLTNESLVYPSLIGELTFLGLTSLSFERGLDLAELTTFVELSTRKKDDINALGGWLEAFREKDIRHITLDHVLARGDVRPPDPAQEAERASGLHRAALETITTVLTDVRQTRRFDIGLVEGVVKLMVGAALDKTEVFTKLMTIKNMDLYTFYHSVNVAMISLLIGIKLKLSVSLLNRLCVAAMLHDVGKMCIPESILKKPGALSEDEWQTMQSHPAEGAKVLALQPKIDPLILIVAAQHHARYDMTGYPTLEGISSQHIMGGIVAVADTYDALTSNRAYRKAMMPDHAMQLVIEGRDTHFHPQIVKAFAHMAGLFPVGTVVRLTTNEVAVVCKPNSNDICRPLVRLVSGVGPSAVGGALADLTKRSTGGRYLKSIVTSLDPADVGLIVERFTDHH